MEKEIKFEVYRSIVKKDTPYCFHRHAEIDEQNRVLNCRDCGAIIDAFEFLLVMAMEEKSVQMNVDRLKIELRKLSDECDKLSKQVTYMRRKAKDNKLSISK